MKTALLPSLLLVVLISILAGVIFGIVGYNAGKNYGTALVYEASFALGYNDAFINNKSDGYDVGYNDGIVLGMRQGEIQIDKSKIDEARSIGFTEGKRSGYDEGYSIGLSVGTRALQTARNEGIAEGRNIGYNEGYDKGLEDGTLEGIKVGIDGFLISKRTDIRRELERENHICNSTNVCEKTVSNDTSTGRRVWSVFNLNTMIHSINVEWTTDTAVQRKQQVIVDYIAGTLSLYTALRTSNYTTPLLVYSFQETRLAINNSSETDQVQTEFLMSWYTGSANAKSIGDNAGITWVLSANRN